jgi:hypothetical protein
MVLRCLKKGTEISRTSTPIEICSKPPPPHPLDASVILLGLTPNLTQFAHDFFHRPHLELKSSEPANSLVLAGPAIAPQELAPGGSLRTWIENGGTAILFSPSAKIAKLFPEQILNVTTNLAEFADWVPVRDSVMSSGLKPMDLKWWSRPNDERLFIASQSHRLRSGADAREFLRYIPPHSYISADKVPEQYRTVLFQLTAGKGRIWICDLDLEQCLSREPLARQFTENLWRAAVDPDFEKGLHPIPSHEELLSRESSRP